MEKKKRLGALDVFIIMVILVCVVSIGIRFFTSRSSDVGEKAQLDHYIVTVQISNIRETSARNYLEKGTAFYTKTDKQYFGDISDGDKTITDAVRSYDGLDGQSVSVVNTGTGDFYRVDVEVSFKVKGKLDANGGFMHNGNKYIGVNQELEIYSKYLAVNALVTDISKAK